MKSLIPHPPIKPRIKSVLVLTGALLLAACAATPPQVRSDFDHSANFAAYHTFGFPETTGTDRGGYTSLTTTRFKDAVRREMTARGYTFAEASPDLTVNFYSEIRDKTRVYSYPWYGYGWGYGYPWYGGGYYGYGHYYRPRYGFYSAWPFYPPYYGGGYDVVQYQTGTLKIDVIDSARKQMVWEATVEEPLTDEAQENPQPVIDHLVGEMFKKFPGGTTTQ